MKKSFLIVFFISQFAISTSIADYAGWTNIGAALPKSKGTVNLTALDIVGDSIWICSGLGNSFNQLPGEIYFSSDRGKSFSTQSTKYGTYCIKMLNSKLGYAAGMEGQVYKTTNGGEEWLRFGSASNTLTAMDFAPGSDTGYVGGMSGVLKKITPGGLVSVASATSNDIRAISCPSRNHAFILWWSDIFFYDGYNPCEELQISVETNKPTSLIDLFMFNDTLGWVTGAYGLVAITKTGGWSLNEESGYYEQKTDLTKDLYSIKFIDVNRGVACGYGGNIITSSNGGKTWTKEAEGLVSEMLLAAHFFSNSDILVVGNSKENSTPSVLMKVNATLVENNDFNNEFSIYPNPATDYIEISQPSENSKLSEGLQIKIYDVFGESLISVAQTSSSVQKIDVSALPAGIYFVRVGEIIQKFIKL